MSKTNREIINVKNVKKTYKDNGVEVFAVRGIDLIVNSGEFTAIVGPSGSGKTTFLNSISGLDTPSEGVILLDGKELGKMNGKELSDMRRDNIGFIFQSYNLIPVLTVEENIEYIMMLQGVNSKDRKKRVEKILKEVELEGFEKRFPPQLSGGQQQRVAVARAMVSNPKLILADEPTANLDSKTSNSLLEMMKRLNKETNMTFLFSTHDPLIMKKADRVITLKDGIIESDITKSTD